MVKQRMGERVGEPAQQGYVEPQQERVASTVRKQSYQIKCFIPRLGYFLSERF